MLLTAMARLQLRHPADKLACQMFGSPPVLAHKKGGGSADVLKVMCWWLRSTLGGICDWSQAAVRLSTAAEMCSCTT